MISIVNNSWDPYGVMVNVYDRDKFKIDIYRLVDKLGLWFQGTILSSGKVAELRYIYMYALYVYMCQ